MIADTSFYAVITPLLPHYKHTLHLSTQGVGILSAAYYAGLLLAALPSGMVEARIGQRRTIVLSMLLFATASVGMAFSPNLELLELSRFVQGIAGACVWTGAFGWGLDAAPPDQRGRMVGALLSSTVLGSMLGPPLGALAELVGPHLLFSAFGIVCMTIAGLSLQLPEPQHRRAGQPSNWRLALRSRPLIFGVAVTTLAGVAFGLVTVLGTLRLSHQGASSGLIAAVFVLVAICEIGINRMLGRLIDRRGAMLPIRVGLLLTATMLFLFALPASVAPQMAAIVVTICCATTYWTPSMGLLSTTAEAGGLTQSGVVALTTFVWSAGSLLGSAGGGSVAGHSSDFTAMALAAALVAAAFVWSLSMPHQSSAGPESR